MKFELDVCINDENQVIISAIKRNYSNELLICEVPITHESLLQDGVYAIKLACEIMKAKLNSKE